MLSANLFSGSVNLKADIAFVAALKIGNQILALASSILIARYFTPAEVGKYALFIALLNVLLIVGGMGTNISFMKDVTIAGQEHNSSLVSSYLSFRVVNLLTLVPVTIIAGILLESLWVTAFAFLTFCLLQLVHLYAYEKRACGNYVISELTEWGAFRLFTFCSVCIAIIVAEFHVFYMAVVTFVAVFFSSVIWFWRSALIDLNLNLANYKKLLKVSFPFFVIHFASLLLIYTDTFAIKIILGYEALAYYDVSYKLAMAILFLNTSITAVIAPRIARWHAERKYIKIKQVLIAYLKLTGVASVILFVLGVIFCDAALSLWGSEYTSVSNVFLILLFGALVQFVFGGMSVYLSMAGYQSIAAKISLGAGIFNMVANVILIPIFGLVGAAAATCFSVLVVALLGAVYVRKYLGLHLNQ